MNKLKNEKIFKDIKSIKKNNENIFSFNNLKKVIENIENNEIKNNYIIKNNEIKNNKSKKIYYQKKTIKKFYEFKNEIKNVNNFKNIFNINDDENNKKGSLKIKIMSKLFSLFRKKSNNIIIETLEYDEINEETVNKNFDIFFEKIKIKIFLIFNENYFEIDIIKNIKKLDYPPYGLKIKLKFFKCKYIKDKIKKILNCENNMIESIICYNFGILINHELYKPFFLKNIKITSL